MPGAKASGCGDQDPTGRSPIKGWRWNGDAFEPCHSIPIEDRGFRYGMSLFETVALRNGRPLFLAEHLERLSTACRQCAIALPTAALENVADLLLQCDADGVTRIYVTADNRILVLSESRSPILRTAYSISPDPVAHLPYPMGLKTANYWRNMASVQSARASGYDEALLADPSGALISACMANLFAVHGHTISTPFLDCGARPGVVRAWAASRTEVVERELRLLDLATADEIFLTNSWIGIVPVSHFRRPFRTPAPIAAELAERYQTEVIAP